MWVMAKVVVCICGKPTTPKTTITTPKPPMGFNQYLYRYDVRSPVIALAGNLGEATISIVEDPALVAARQSYLHLKSAPALSDGMTKLGASTIDMGAGVNTLSIYGATQLSDTTFKFADTSTNLINVGGDSISMPIPAFISTTLPSILALPPHRALFSPIDSMPGACRAWTTS